MPLIILVGIPASGKTRVSNELKIFFESRSVPVIHINEESLGLNKIQSYSSNFEEKNLRSALKSAVERNLNSENLIILDSMNYIKGYRYEIFCIVRQTQTTQCVVYMDVSKDIAFTRNSQYPVDLFNDLSNRMEVPNQKNKWDNPLVILRDNEDIPFENIFQAVMSGRNLTENMATVKQPTLVQDYLHLLDQNTQKVIEFILKAQEDYAEGACIKVPESEAEYFFQKKLQAIQLRKFKQQFLKINKMKPCSLEKSVEAFVEYINSNIA